MSRSTSSPTFLLSLYVGIMSDSFTSASAPVGRAWTTRPPVGAGTSAGTLDSVSTAVMEDARKHSSGLPPIQGAPGLREHRTSERGRREFLSTSSIPRLRTHQPTTPRTTRRSSSGCRASALWGDHANSAPRLVAANPLPTFHDGARSPPENGEIGQGEVGNRWQNRSWVWGGDCSSSWRSLAAEPGLVDRRGIAGRAVSAAPRDVRRRAADRRERARVRRGGDPATFKRALAVDGNEATRWSPSGRATTA